MEKNKITVEHLLNSTSKNIIWQLIGTDSGLQKWIADSVTLDGDQLNITSTVYAAVKEGKHDIKTHFKGKTVVL